MKKVIAEKSKREQNYFLIPMLAFTILLGVSIFNTIKRIVFDGANLPTYIGTIICTILISVGLVLVTYKFIAYKRYPIVLIEIENQEITFLQSKKVSVNDTLKIEPIYAKTKNANSFQSLLVTLKNQKTIKLLYVENANEVIQELKNLKNVEM